MAQYTQYTYFPALRLTAVQAQARCAQLTPPPPAGSADGDASAAAAAPSSLLYFTPAELQQTGVGANASASTAVAAEVAWVLAAYRRAWLAGENGLDGPALLWSGLQALVNGSGLVALGWVHGGALDARSSTLAGQVAAAARTYVEALQQGSLPHAATSADAGGCERGRQAGSPHHPIRSVVDVCGHGHGWMGGCVWPCVRHCFPYQSTHS